MVAAYPWDFNALREFAVFLVTCPVDTLRDPDRAVWLARKAVAGKGNSYNVAALGAAQYRAGDFGAAVANLDLAIRRQERRPDMFDQFFRAMAYWRVGNTDMARQCYDDAARELKLPHNEGEAILHMLREETAALLGVK